ncbi:hypothetical protein [Nocardioides coralli]|uniref:hypothetical protein n=1 Tax=Nocardioides coralli TaxID=2872154 RepID=UPI001CA43D20|nr:hypothetical protein [Nocardioides coralli]QZY27900.1 hypothetical protein K6T13_10335 [Nocardioides coralli]
MIQVGLALWALQLALRAWMVYPSYFFTDDYRLLLDAESSRFGLAYLLDPFDSQFMPLGRLMAWLVSRSGELAWGVAATMTLVWTALSGLACLLMLATLFGRRWAILAPYAIYLSSVITIPATMWWAAAINQIPTQVALFVAITCWVQYLRTSRVGWAAGTFGAVFLGLLSYVKALLIVPVLAFIPLAYFTTGTFSERVRWLLRNHWRVIAPSTAIVAAYSLFYVSTVPQPFTGTESTKVTQVADSMLGTSLPTALLGGPWRWWDTTPPIVIAQPPAWLVHAAWAVLALLIAYSVLRRRNAWTGWLLLTLYSMTAFALLATSRGQEYGAFAGLDYRYLTDVAGVVALVTGLVFLPLRRAPLSSRPRWPTALRVTVPPRAVVVVVGAIVTSGIVSGVGYVHYWHHENAGATFVPRMVQGLRAAGDVDLANQELPGTVMPPYTSPMNQTQEFTRLLDADVDFPDVTTRLRMFAPDGELVDAIVTSDLASLPGPRGDCGWLVRTRPVRIPLTGETFDWSWWVRVGYLSSDDTALRVSLGDLTREVPVTSGLGSVFLRVEGTFDSVVVQSAAEEATVCIDRIDVGQAAPLS